MQWRQHCRKKWDVQAEFKVNNVTFLKTSFDYQPKDPARCCTVYTTRGSDGCLMNLCRGFWLGATEEGFAKGLPETQYVQRSCHIFSPLFVCTPVSFGQHLKSNTQVMFATSLPLKKEQSIADHGSGLMRPLVGLAPPHGHSPITGQNVTPRMCSPMEVVYTPCGMDVIPRLPRGGR